MIRSVRREELDACARIVRESFMTVAEEFGITQENAPRFTAFSVTAASLANAMDAGDRLMFAYGEMGELIGYYALAARGDGGCGLSDLSVLPLFRHRGVGRALLCHAVRTARERGFPEIGIPIVEENAKLRTWYEKCGAVHTGTKKMTFSRLRAAI